MELPLFLKLNKLQHKLILTIVLTLIISFGITTFLFIKYNENEMKKAEVEKIRLFASSISNVIKEEMVTGNAEIIVEWLTNVQSSSGFKQVKLLRTNGIEAFTDNKTIDSVNNHLGSKTFPQRLLSKPQEKPSSINMDMLNKAMQTLTDVDYSEVINGEPVHTQLIPLIRDERCLTCHGYENNQVRGILQISASKTKLINEIKNNVLKGIFFSIIIITTISIIMNFSIHKTAIKPISTVIFKITSAATQQEQTTSQQATSVNQITATIEELNASSKQVYAKAESLAHQAKESLTVANEGQVAVEKSITEMNLIKNKVSATAEEVLTLSEKTNQIGAIINVVEDIANKTDMLALNASIEAAKAGEHGKGFAVVASEVRSLADQSKKATEKVTTLIQEIQSSVNSTVMSTEKSAKSVDTGVGHIMEVGSTISNAISIIRTTAEAANEIAISSRQESIAIEQATQAMNTINEGMQETSAATKESLLIAQQLQDLVERRKAKRDDQ